MSELRLNIIDARDAIHGTIHGSVADAVIAALSAEPETIAELEAALARFNKPTDDHTPFASFVAGKDTEPWDAGIVVVDLAARIVASESSYSCPLTQGEVEYHDGSDATDVWLRYRLPDDWLILFSVIDYEAMRDERLAVRIAEPVIDTRQILYGKPLFEFLVSECLGESAGIGRVQGPESNSDLVVGSELDGGDRLDGQMRNDDILRSLHARWLMTSRDDLGGRTPRAVILEKQDFIDSDIDSRGWQWSLLREAPTPLSRDSKAYRFGGFGTHEYVTYYYFVRQVLTQCWERVNHELDDSKTRMPGMDALVRAEAGSATAAYSARPVNQVDALLEWLEQVGQTWLNCPSEEFDGRIPAAIIESERRRIPLVVSAKDIMIDENCELCRMMADETNDFGPTFWHLDGCNMDEGFEFSAYQTREEWEAEQRRWEEFTEEFERKWTAEHPTTGNEASFLDQIDEG